MEAVEPQWRASQPKVRGSAGLPKTDSRPELLNALDAKLQPEQSACEFAVLRRIVASEAGYVNLVQFLASEDCAGYHLRRHAYPSLFYPLGGVADERRTSSSGRPDVAFGVDGHPVR